MRERIFNQIESNISLLIQITKLKGERESNGLLQGGPYTKNLIHPVALPSEKIKTKASKMHKNEKTTLSYRNTPSRT